MFQACRYKNGLCPYAATSTYDPDTSTYEGLPYTFCGKATGADNRVSQLDKCWDDMSKGERTKHSKTTTERVMTKQGYTLNKYTKTWRKVL
tara:strand:- start:1872 stop:2144 length:273 start_codon:yes stop_codon:yes gene_type:complete